MRALKRNRRLLYLCTLYEDMGIAKYKEPVPIKINYQPANSDSDLIALGTEYPMRMKIKSDLYYKDYFHTGDRVYIGIEPPAQFDGLCRDANFEVDNEPMIALNTIEVTLRKLSDQQ